MDASVLTTPRAHLLLGGCFELFDAIPDQSIHLTVLDLPFGVTKCEWDRKLDLERLWTELRRVTTATGAVLAHATQPFTSDLVMSNRAWFKYGLVWQKSNPTLHMHCWNRPLSDHEDILVFSPGTTVGKHRSARPMAYNPQGLVELSRPVKRAKGTTSNIYRGGGGASTQTHTNFPRSVLRFESVERGIRVHETQKPVELLSYLIRTFSNPGDLVLDPTMGSGSTGVAATEEGRDFIGFEVGARYFDIAAERIRKTGAAVQKVEG